MRTANRGEKQKRGEPINKHILQETLKSEILLGKCTNVRGNLLIRKPVLGDLEHRSCGQLIGLSSAWVGMSIVAAMFASETNSIYFSFIILLFLIACERSL